jgi:hypothetical protein
MHRVLETGELDDDGPPISHNRGRRGVFPQQAWGEGLDRGMELIAHDGLADERLVVAHDHHLEAVDQPISIRSAADSLPPGTTQRLG